MQSYTRQAVLALAAAATTACPTPMTVPTDTMTSSSGDTTNSTNPTETMPTTTSTSTSSTSSDDSSLGTLSTDAFTSDTGSTSETSGSISTSETTGEPVCEDCDDARACCRPNAPADCLSGKSCYVDCGSEPDICLQAFCGDGFENASPNAPEQCDDKNDISDDGCSAQCKDEDRLIFVTSSTYCGNMAEYNGASCLRPGVGTGIERADTICNQAAQASDHEHKNRAFKAWLSDGVDSPYTRFDKTFEARYINTMGETIVMGGWKGLTEDLPTDEDVEYLSAKILNMGGIESSKTYAWTGTLKDGQTDTKHCNKWTETDEGDADEFRAEVGKPSELSKDWTQDDDLHCDNNYPIYCFEDPTP